MWRASSAQRNEQSFLRYRRLALVAQRHWICWWMVPCAAAGGSTGRVDVVSRLPAKANSFK